MTEKQLLQLKKKKLTAEERIAIEKIDFQQDVSMDRREEVYLRQIKNPYAFKCGDISVNVCFSEDEKTIQDAILSYFQNGMGVREHSEKLS